MADKETLVVDDLTRVLIRVQKDDSVEWENVDAYKATDLQFDTWARSRAQIEDRDAHWKPEKRARFCDMLWQMDALVLLRRGVRLPE